MKRTPIRLRRAQRGVSLIEVLVSLVILMIGLLGLVGVMIQSQRAQVESYQRVQALMLAQDIASRMNSNKAVASCYVLPTYVGTGNSVVPAAGACAVGTLAQRARAQQDLEDWRDLLLGSAEKLGGLDVGAILGGRGCITAAGDVYQISIAWQGAGPTSAPPAGVPCGQTLYGDDAARRAVSLTVQLSILS